MKKIVLCMLLASAQLGAITITSSFGPNSPFYNQPLYFSTNKMIARPEKKKERKKHRSVIKKIHRFKRDKIWKDR